MNSPLSTLLRSMLASRLDGPGLEWLDAACEAARGSDTEALCRAYSAAGRRAGRAPLALTDGERRSLAETAGQLRFDRWTIDDAARALLLMARSDSPGDSEARAAAILECFDRGDTREQESWLRSVSLLPDPARFVPIAVDACRTNIVPLFEAIACDNPFPAQHFPELHFNQLVLKALFIGVPLAGVIGLADHLNPELTRMTLDFAAERRAAGRPVPADLPMALHVGNTEEPIP